mmetsp:Transcript_22155/g.18439  ORF Transcript_22155/g.18439 Transcript_22155/m.18439 type:complete len:80 (+) Transcript_22155:314-553(+)
MIKFINMKIDENTSFKDEIKDTISSSDMSIGLHTCGMLTKYQFDQSINLNLNKILNIGCCYPKIDVTDNFDVNKVFISN